MTNLLTDAELQEIRERAQAATPGPWIEKCGVFKHYVASTVELEPGYFLE